MPVRKLSPAQVAKVADLRSRGVYLQTIADEMGVHYSTIRRTLKRLKNEDDDGGPGRRVYPCGTNAAYARHIRNKEPACQACLDAHAEQRNKYPTDPAKRKVWNDARYARAKEEAAERGIPISHLLRRGR